MYQPLFTLLSMPGCYACKIMRGQLETLHYENAIQLPFTYEIINIEKRDSLIKQWDV
jgi:hypothetical protein